MNPAPHSHLLRHLVVEALAAAILGLAVGLEVQQVVEAQADLAESVPVMLWVAGPFKTRHPEQQAAKSVMGPIRPEVVAALSQVVAAVG